jgi:MFS family permease
MTSDLRRQPYLRMPAWSATAGGPSPLAGFLLAIVVLLSLVLVGRVLFLLNPNLAGVYALTASLLLGWLAARGRYWSPSTRQYLMTMLIALIPVIGTAYAAFFAGLYIAQRRGLRLSFYFTLLLSLGLLIFWQVRMEGYELPAYLAVFRLPVTPTPTALPTSTAVVTPLTSPTPSSTATFAPTFTPTVTSLPRSDCLPWYQVTMDLVGQEACIYGDYVNIAQKEDKTYVLSFSDEPGTFQVWSYPKPFEPYLAGEIQRCVQVEGWVKTSGVRPIIIIGSEGRIKSCP